MLPFAAAIWCVLACIGQETLVMAESSPPPALTLDAVVAMAEQNSPNLREAVAEVEASRGRTVQAGLYPNPTIVGGGQQLSGSDSQYFATLSQEIVTKGKLRLDRAATSLTITQAELQFVRTRFDLLTNVRQKFYSTLAAQRRVEILESLVDVARKSQQSAVLLQKGGEGTPADTLLLEIELERAMVGLQNASAILAATRRELAAAIGTPNLEIQRVEGDLTLDLPAYADQVVQKGYLDRNALIQIAEVEVDRNRILARRAQVEPFPNFTVGSGYVYQVPEPNNIAVVQIGFPIPVWNRNQGNIRATRANISKSIEAVSRTENELTSQLAAAVGNYQAAEQLVNRLEHEIVPRARRTVDIAQNGYTQGQFDFLRLLQAQKTYIEVDLAYINAQEARWLAAAEIAGITQAEVFPEPAADEDAP